MHFLGVAGMPRRIPGTQIALVYIIINNPCGKNFTKIDMWEVSLNLIFLQIKLFNR